MRLRELIQGLGACTVEGSLDREIAGLAYDSRRVLPGMVFVAVPGQQVDGHSFIPGAIERGASAVICERNGFIARRATRIRVPDAREALGRAAATYYGHPSQRLKVVGVTGTNGKTTVAFILKSILEVAGWRTGLISTIRYEVGERVIPALRTTPEALEIQDMLAAMERAGCRCCVLEISSLGLDQRRVAGISFDAAVFTNLSPNHLDYHASIEEYFAAKRRLFATLEAGAKRAGAIINIDDPYGAKLARDSALEIRLTYGLGDAARVRASGILTDLRGTRLMIDTPSGSWTGRIPLLGIHNVYNVLAAVGTALILRVPLQAIRSAVSSLSPIPGRMESLSQGQPFSVFVDYAHTEAALRQALQTLRSASRGRLLLVFGCGGGRDSSKRALMGRAAAELAHITIITNDNPRHERPAQITDEIVRGYRTVRSGSYYVEPDRRRAIEGVIRLAQAGDVVLIAGKGHETYQEFEDTVVPFDDRVHAREALDNAGWRIRWPSNGG